MNPLTASQFRLDFPEFANTSTYPDTLINAWLTVAIALVNPAVWSNVLNLGTELCAAHYIVLAVRDQAAAQAGAPVGEPATLTASEGAGDLSVAFDTALAGYANAGNWNTTSYGQRFWALARMMGAGPIQTLYGCGW